MPKVMENSAGDMWWLTCPPDSTIQRILSKLQKDLQHQQLRVGSNVGLCGMILQRIQLLGKPNKGNKN